MSYPELTSTAQEVVITGIETAALRLGAKVATQGARTWLSRRQKVSNRSKSLSALAAAELASPLERHKFDNLVERIGNDVAEHLVPVLKGRSANVPQEEIEAALLAVEDVLEEANIDDEALFSVDVNAEKLAGDLRARFPGRAQRESLAEIAWPIYDLALNQACRTLVQVIQQLAPFASKALSEVLSRLTEQSNRLTEILARIPVTDVLASRSGDRDAAFEAVYLNQLADTLNRLELLGLPGDDLPTLPLTVAYLSLTIGEDKTRARPARFRTSWSDEMQLTSEIDNVPVETAIGQHQRVLMLGEAGSGKTTLLHWLAVKASRGELVDSLASWNGKVPFLLRLRSFAADALPLPEDFVQHCAGMVSGRCPDAWAERILNNGRGLLLVDGVDEVPLARRKAVRIWLRDLLLAYPETRVVVTSRTAAADRNWLAADNFASVTLRPMTSSNIAAFIDRWHRAARIANTSFDVSAAERKLLGQMERPHLRELAATPLLCAMLCALNLPYQSELPRNRMDLYAKALAMLLHLRDAERGIDTMLDDSAKRSLLRDIAWRLTQAGKVEFSKAHVLEHIQRKLEGMPNASGEPNVLLSHLLERSGVLRSPIPSKVDFVHRTFQEYLAANEAMQQHHEETLLGHAHLDTWRETIVMACGHATTKQADTLITGILSRAEEEPRYRRKLHILAASCVETLQDISANTRRRLDSVITANLVPRNMREAPAIATVGHRLFAYYPRDSKDLTEAQAAAAVRSMALTGAKEALPLLGQYAKDSRPNIQWEISQAWEYFDAEQFAEVVLSDARLPNGHISVQRLRFIPFLNHLQHLARLSISINSWEPFDSFEIFSEVPKLWSFRSASTPPDAHLLAEHTGLRSLALNSLAPGKSDHWLTRFAALNSIDLAKLTRPFGEFLGSMPSVTRVGTPERKTRGWSSVPETNVNYLFMTSHEDHLEKIKMDGFVANFPGIKRLWALDYATVTAECAAFWPLEEVNIQLGEISDLSLLTRFPNLRRVMLWNNDGEIDLSPLKDLSLELSLSRRGHYLGFNQLGSGVKVVYKK